MIHMHLYFQKVSSQERNCQAVKIYSVSRSRANRRSSTHTWGSSVYLAEAKILRDAMTKYPVRRVTCKIYDACRSYESDRRKTAHRLVPIAIGRWMRRLSGFQRTLHKSNLKNFAVTELWCDWMVKSRVWSLRLGISVTVITFQNSYFCLSALMKKTMQGERLTDQVLPNGSAVYAFGLIPHLSRNV